MLRLLEMSPSMVLTTSLIQIQSSWQLSLLELPPCRNTVTPSSDSSDTYTFTVQSGPTTANTALPPTLVSKPLIPHLPIQYLLHLPPPLSVAPGCHYAPPASSPPHDSLRVSQWNAGSLRARSTKLLSFVTSCRPYLHSGIQS